MELPILHNTSSVALLPTENRLQVRTSCLSMSWLPSIQITHSKQRIAPLSFPGTIFMDLSFDEPLCLEPQHRKVLTFPITEEEQYHVLSYPLEELLAEKMRGLVERGKSRDYYDVWRLLKEESDEIDLKLLGTVLLKKLSHKGFNMHDTNDFLPTDIDEVKYYCSPLPQLDEVMRELRDMLDKSVAPHLTSQAV